MFEVRVTVTADTPEEESLVVNAIASEFIRQGISSVSVIANNEHVNYVNGEVYNVTTGLAVVFRTDPRAPVESFILGDTLLN